MENLKEWRIIFCSECHEPTPPGQLTEYNGHLLCELCEDDLDIYPEGLHP